MTEKNRKKLILIDGTSLIYRSFFAIRNEMRTADGQSTRGTYGFLSMVFKLIDDYKPDYFAVAWDLKGPTFRHEAYDDYKAGRKPMPEDLASEMPILQDVLAALDIKNLSKKGYEADDILGTVGVMAAEQDVDVLIVTGDRDALQLVSERVNVMINKVGISNFTIYDLSVLEDEYQMTPLQFIDYKALMGDSSDNIPGVPRVGKVTAKNLIVEFGSIDNIIQHIGDIKSKSIRENILNFQNNLLKNIELVTIVKDVNLDISLEDLKFGNMDRHKVKELFVKLNFNRFQKHLKLETISSGDSNVDDSIKSMKVHCVETADSDFGLASAIDEKHEIFMKVLSDNNHLTSPSIDGIILSDGEDVWVIEGEYAVKIIAEINSKGMSVSGHNLVEDMFVLLSNGFENISCGFDTQIAEYVLNPSKRSYEIKALSLSRLHICKLEEKTPIWEQPGEYIATIIGLMNSQLKTMKDEGLVDLFKTIEMPLVKILSMMERNGVAVDKQVLNKLGDKFEAQMKILEQEIYEFAGEAFNINSPAQLGEILFDKLKLPNGKKTKRGYSTSADILEKIRNKHPVVDRVLEYRGVSKLFSTYVQGLSKLIGEDGRIRPRFQQTVASTGRLSCTEPNLQNIPIRTEQGREIRKAFVAQGADRVLVGADYSQIELRILAHLSKDRSLIQAFNENMDIHTMTAMRVFKLNKEDITPLYRSRAKAINFGVIYGMSGFGLSENLDITRKQAQKYIDDYFEKYDAVKDFMDNEIRKCKETGFTETLFGRKRYISEINSENFMVRKAGERLAMNTPIQGTAADIMKIAMIRVEARIRKELPAAKLILQIHDELIVEVAKCDIEQTSKILREEMEAAADLVVKLDSNAEIGRSWFELK